MSRKPVLIILIVLGISGIYACYHLPRAKATEIIWKEGHITADERWFYIPDTVYRVIGDVYVDHGVTLTIEPGVKVQFADGFSLIVEGSLNASGIEADPIVFTSSRISDTPPHPYPGAWNTIEFSGSENESFVMKYCELSYANKGIILPTIRKGFALIENSEIINSSETGIKIAGDGQPIVIRNNKISSNQMYGIQLRCPWLGTISNVTISSNTVFSNGMHGISLDSNGNFYDITISSNIIMSNDENGITATAHEGSSIQDITISSNIVSSNSRNGIELMNDYDGQDIKYVNVSFNVISCNGLKGIHLNKRSPYYRIYSNMIFNNTICYNTYGIFYDHTSFNQAMYNNVYENSWGAYVIGANEKAEYNYWGHPTGPYHPSLNPEGQGNPVNGDGTDLDFIPFLTSPIPPINERPVAVLEVDKLNPIVNETVTFDATGSTDDGRIDYYFFDFGDGMNSGWTTLPVVIHKYAEEGKYNATLIVMDDFGVTSLDGNLVYVEITVVPEFPSMLILPLFMIATLLAVIVYNKKRYKSQELQQPHKS